MGLTDIVVELEDQAVDLGFENLEDALECGYCLDTRSLVNGNVRLVKGE